MYSVNFPVDFMNYRTFDEIWLRLLFLKIYTSRWLRLGNLRTHPLLPLRRFRSAFHPSTQLHNLTLTKLLLVS